MTVPEPLVKPVRQEVYGQNVSKWRVQQSGCGVEKRTAQPGSGGSWAMATLAKPATRVRVAVFIFSLRRQFEELEL